MGVLKAVGSEQACLTKPWWLAADRRGCLQARCQKKLIFKGFFGEGCSGSSMTVFRFRYLGRGDAAGGEICMSFLGWLKSPDTVEHMFQSVQCI